MFMKDWFELLGPIAIIAGFLWKFWLKKKIDEANDLYKTVQIIASEFKPNGGSSLRDAINRIESKVDLQEQKIVGLIKSSPVGTWISDQNGKYIDVNKTLCVILDRTESEIKGDNWTNWLHADDKVSVISEWHRVIKNQIDFNMSYRFVLPDGKIQKVHATAYQLKSDKGDMIGFLGTLLTVGVPETEIGRSNW